MTEEQVFLSALDLPDAAARAAYLDEACGGDAAFRRRVEVLLTAHFRTGEFLDSPAVKRVKVGAGEENAVTIPGGAVSAEPDDKDEADDLRFLTPSTRPDALGRLGHYEMLQVLGRGGFGIVFRAFDDVLQRVVAVKVMAPQIATLSPARKRFLREARSSAAVRHEHVVQVYEVGEQPLPHLVMEFIPGETLKQKLDRTGPLEVSEVLRIGRQIAEGLAAAHASDLIHRDIKPGNILLEGGAQKAKITDFGLARAADDASISQSGIVAGTPMFMAPEQAQGHPIDQRADLFSLGSVLYQMVSGRPPFRAPSALAVLKRVAEEPPRPIPEIIPETPAWLCSIIAKLHAKNPRDRFQSAREVADLLADCEAKVKAKQEVKNVLPAAVKPSGRKWVAAAAVLLLAGVALAVTEFAGVTHLFQWQQARPDPLKHRPEAPPPIQVAQNRDGWVQLFNGKDLTGWKTRPEAPGHWEVKDGILVGSRRRSVLYSERGDYANFHLRVETRINLGGDSGVFFRTGFGTPQENLARQHGPDGGFEVEIHKNLYARKTGTVTVLQTDGPPLILGLTSDDSLTQPDEWFTLELIVEQDRFITKVNGKETANCRDPLGKHSSGHLGLQVWSPSTLVQFRKIEIKELPPVPVAKQEPLPRTFKNSIGMEFVLVPKGKSWLGGDRDKLGEREVETLADFYLGKYEVTQEEWTQVMGENPSHFARTGGGSDAVKDVNDADLKRFPVETVSWDQCQIFVAKLNKLEKESGWVYRLPKAAEWEYACRGGPMSDRLDSAFDFYFARPTNTLLPELANFNQRLKRPCKVGSYEANHLGIHDLHGNLHEWCHDVEKTADGSLNRVARGGSWDFPPWDCRAGFFDSGPTDFRHFNLGLRLARVPLAQGGEPTPGVVEKQETPAPVAAAWTVLKPIEMKSEGGATLKLQEDGSTLASGEHPAKDSYSLTFRNFPAKIQALRLEVLPHSSLPNNGPGRHESGEFVLTTVKVHWELPSNPGAPRLLKIAKAWADNSRGADSEVQFAIDEDDNTGWMTEVGKPHFAVFELAEPLTATEGAVLRVTLEFKWEGNQFQLGCFRLSATADAKAVRVDADAAR